MSLDLLKDKLKDSCKEARWVPAVGGGLVAYCVLCVILALIWSREPATFDVQAVTEARAEKEEQRVVVGYTTANTLSEVVRTLWKKQRNYVLGGGYLTNDIMPPGVFLDNMPSWEFGVLVQVRDLARALRKDMSRSQSQSAEDANLALAEPRFNFDNNSWWLPTTEQEYKRGQDDLKRYMSQLASREAQQAQFYARADNLRNWLADVETRLGSLSQRLSASVGRRVVNTDLAGDSAATQSTFTAEELDVRTPWIEIDNVFYEARGTSWALLHFLKAIEIDFKDVLEKKNALVSVRQIIRELEATQETVWSPMILNGSGFGALANHSLVMANYISRANAAIIDLRELLSQG